MITLNNKLVDISTVVVENIDMTDYPKFCDAYFSEAKFTDGTSLTDAELEQLLDENYGLFADKVNEAIY